MSHTVDETVIILVRTMQSNGVANRSCTGETSSSNECLVPPPSFGVFGFTKQEATVPLHQCSSYTPLL